jgi:sec-independent protein translocase protein TatC
MALHLTGRVRSPSLRPTPDEMTVWEHLTELRRRLVVAVAAYVVAACIAAAFYGRELSLLQHPYCQISPHHCGLYVTGPLDPLTLRVKLAAFGGLLLASPVLLWELWRFITPGLRSHEKRYGMVFSISAALFFALGCLTAYLTFPHALGWLIGVGGSSLHELFNPNGYLTLILLLMLSFGVMFEFPVVLVALQLVGLVSPTTLLRSWRWAVLGITICSGVLTPSSDPFSMLALAVPLVAFYFAAIGIGKVFAPRRARPAAG